MIEGATFPATPEGFREMLIAANKLLATGREIMAIVPLGRSIGVMWRTRTTEKRPITSFFEDE